MLSTEFFLGAVLAVGYVICYPYYDSLVLPLGVHHIFFSRFLLYELLTKCLLVKSWYAHVSAIVHVAPKKYPQKQGWTDSVTATCFLAMEASVAGIAFGSAGHEKNMSFGTVRLLGNCGATVYLILLYMGWSCMNVSRTPWVTFQISKYLGLSALFILLDISGTMIVVMGISTSPALFQLLVIARIGTALCHFFAFLLPSHHAHDPVTGTDPATLDGMDSDSQFYKLETKRLDSELIQVETEKARILEAIREQNAKLEAARELMREHKSSIKAYADRRQKQEAQIRALQRSVNSMQGVSHTVKASMAQAEKAIEKFMRQERESGHALANDPAHTRLRNASAGLRKGLGILWQPS